VNLDEGYVLFKKTRRRQLKTKYSTRKVYLGEGLKEQLRLLRPLAGSDNEPVEQRFVFPSRKPGQPLDNVKKALKTAVLQARVLRDGQPMNVTLHSFRKAYASWLDDGNVPESVIQSNLGHAPGSAVTRKHYQRAYDDSKQAVIDLDVPLSTQKKNGRWQSKPKIWQSMATPNKKQF
jgi:integrase